MPGTSDSLGASWILGLVALDSSPPRTDDLLGAGAAVAVYTFVACSHAVSKLRWPPGLPTRWPLTQAARSQRCRQLVGVVGVRASQEVRPHQIGGQRDGNGEVSQWSSSTSRIFRHLPI